MLPEVSPPRGAHRWRVYVIQAGNGMLKVGLSRNIEARLIHLQLWSPFELRLVAHFPVAPSKERWPSVRRAAADAEGIAHAVLDPWRVRGEWFCGNEAVAIVSEWIRRGRLPRRPRGLSRVLYRDRRRAWLRKHYAAKRAAA